MINWLLKKKSSLQNLKESQDVKTTNKPQPSGGVLKKEALKNYTEKNATLNALKARAKSHDLKTTDLLLSVLKESGWTNIGRVVETNDVEFISVSERREVQRTTRFDVEGEMPRNSTIAVNAWNPQKLREAIEVISIERSSDDIGCLVDYEGLQDFDLRSYVVYANSDIPRSTFSSSSSTTSLFGGGDSINLFELCGDRGLLVLCFTEISSTPLFQGIEQEALGTLREFMSTAGSQSGLNAIVLYSEKPPVFSINNMRPDYYTVCNGEKKDWTSEKFIRDLNIIKQELPVAFFFTKMGVLIESGYLEEVLEASMKDEEENNNNMEEEEQQQKQQKEQQKPTGGVYHLPENFENELLGIIPPYLTALLRKETVTYADGFNKSGEAAISYKFTIAGDVFPEEEESYSLFIREVSTKVGRGFPPIGCMGVKHVTRPIPVKPDSKCGNCETALSSTTLKYVCMLDDGATLCENCLHSHLENHPLVILFGSNVSSTTALFGKNHVYFDWNAKQGYFDEEEDEIKHSSVMCDACEGPITFKRYKNLCKDDYDLCEGCFSIFRQFAKGVGNREIFNQFHCRKDDLFCLIRNSNGLTFSRLAGNSSLLTTAMKSKIGIGHTNYSWAGQLPGRGNNKPGIGHTKFSW